MKLTSHHAVTLGGAVLFLIFGVMYSYEAYTFTEDVVAGKVL